jgi:hypothetical protein
MSMPQSSSSSFSTDTPSVWSSVVGGTGSSRASSRLLSRRVCTGVLDTSTIHLQNPMNPGYKGLRLAACSCCSLGPGDFLTSGLVTLDLLLFLSAVDVGGFVDRCFSSGSLCLGTTGLLPIVDDRGWTSLVPLVESLERCLLQFCIMSDIGSWHHVQAWLILREFLE